MQNSHFSVKTMRDVVALTIVFVISSSVVNCIDINDCPPLPPPPKFSTRILGGVKAKPGEICAPI